MDSPLLVFDLDGTLADTAPDLLETLQTVLPRHGISAAADSSYREGIGQGARYLIEYALDRQQVTVDKTILDAIYIDFLHHYETNICVETKLFPGTTDLLDRFTAAGWSFAVCTNKPERMSRLLLAKLGVADRFAAVGGGDSFSRRKPDPVHLLETIATAGRSPHATVMVGDSQTDLDTARGAGIPVVGVTFGYTPVPMAELAPDLLIESFDDLTPDRTKLLLANRAADRALDVTAALAAP